MDAFIDGAAVDYYGVRCLILGGDSWTPNIISVDAFKARFADIADAADFSSALTDHNNAQTDGWKAAIARWKSGGLLPT